jgi:hypothetical protein
MEWSRRVSGLPTVVALVPFSRAPATLSAFFVWRIKTLRCQGPGERIFLSCLCCRTSPALHISFRSLGQFYLSVSIVFQVQNILTEPTVNWKYEFLYVPFFIPFTVVSLCTILFYYRYVGFEVVIGLSWRFCGDSLQLSFLFFSLSGEHRSWFLT